MSDPWFSAVTTMFQNQRVDNVSAHEAVHPVETLISAVEQVIILFHVHRAVATKAIHGFFLPMGILFPTMHLCNQRSNIETYVQALDGRKTIGRRR